MDEMTSKETQERQWPAVTAVVATRDRLELLRRAVDAIIGQTYPGEIECVVVFDQSPVEESFAMEAERRSVRVMSNTRTPGLAGARHTGVLAARGALVAVGDARDGLAAVELEV